MLNMKRHLIRFLVGFVLALGGLLLPNTVSANSINYQCLTYGTSKQSIASGYYVKPAQITANGDQYLVTMTIQTGAKLGNWPVTVLSIDGNGPANVSKTKNGDNFDYSYSFQTNNLNRTINSSISINVPNVYVAKHNISFKFDTSSLPALANASSASSNNQAASSSTANKNSATSSSSASTKNTKSKSTTTSNSKQDKQIAALNKKNKQTQTVIIVGGVAVVVVLGVAAYFFVRRK